MSKEASQFLIGFLDGDRVKTIMTVTMVPILGYTSGEMIVRGRIRMEKRRKSDIHE